MEYVLKFTCLCMLAVLPAWNADAAGPEYLPPNKGYNYEPPRVPFSSAPPNTQVPFPSPPAPPPSYGPPARPPPQRQQPQQQGDQHEHEHHHEPGMPFDFAYAVNEEGNEYSHNANSDGDVTRGEYRTLLPDGRMQIVKYTADWKNGFNAEVTYEGEARYPDQPQGGAGGYSAPARAYGAPAAPAGPAQNQGYKY